MITLPRTICSILSLLFLCSCAIFQPEKPERVVRVKVLADVPFRARNPNWAEEARGIVEAASDYYEREFEIRILTQSVSAWPLSGRVDSTPALLARLQKEFPAAANDGSYDIIISFTTENSSRYSSSGRPRVDRIGNCTQGLSNYVVVPIGKVFRYHGATAEPSLDVIALIHEIGHVFGAEHVEDTASLMHENFGYRTEFDSINRGRIKTNRTCQFAR